MCHSSKGLVESRGSEQVTGRNDARPRKETSSSGGRCRHERHKGTGRNGARPRKETSSCEADSEAYAIAAKALWKATDQSKSQAETTPVQERKPAAPEADGDTNATRAQAGTAPAKKRNQLLPRQMPTRSPQQYRHCGKPLIRAGHRQERRPLKKGNPAPPEPDADAYAKAAKALWKAADQSRAQAPAEERKPVPAEADAIAYATAAEALWKAADQSKAQAAAKSREERKTELAAETDSATNPKPTPSDSVAERSTAETAKARTESKADSSALPASVPVASTNETPRSYVDPLPAAESAPQHCVHSSLTR